MKHETSHTKSNHRDHTSLLDSTIDATEEKVIEARNRLKSALEAAGETYSRVKDRAVEGAKATDKMIRNKPYHAVGIAFGVGALLGFLWSRRGRSND